MEMNSLFLSLGSNQGDRLQILLSAISEIQLQIGTVNDCSSIYETDPHGFEADEPFYNLCLHVFTDFSPETVLNKALQIENLFGRKRQSEGYTSRTLDIDLLYFNEFVTSTENLILPHPRMHERLFVLTPLNELNNKIMHPILKKYPFELIPLITNQKTPTEVLNRKLIQY